MDGQYFRGQGYFDFDAGRAEGRRRRDSGINVAHKARRTLAIKGRRDLLQVLLDSADGIATTDDILPDVRVELANEGKWRGAIPGPLAREGIIRRAGVIQSARPSRHAGWVSRWELVDRPAAVAELGRLDRLLSANGNGSPPGTGEPLQVTPEDGPESTASIPGGPPDGGAE